MPAPGLTFREQDGELHLALPASPYLGEQDPSRWSDGWLHTRDAGTVDPRTGLVRVLGRRDSQVSVGGLKVDLTEVEHTLAALPEVANVVVIHDHAIEAYLVLTEGAGYRRWNARSRPGLPRTSGRGGCTWSSNCRARPPGSSSAARPHSEKALIMIDEIRQFVLDSLTDMNYSIEGIDDDTALGPAAPTWSHSRSPSSPCASRTSSACGSTTTRPSSSPE